MKPCKPGASCIPTRAAATTPSSNWISTCSRPQLTWGTNPGQVIGLGESAAGARYIHQRQRARCAGQGVCLHGPCGPGSASRGWRLTACSIGSMYQRPAVRPDRRSACSQGPQGRRVRPGDGGAGLHDSAARGRSHGAGQSLPGRRFLNGATPAAPCAGGHECRPGRRRRTLRRHFQPQFRSAARGRAPAPTWPARASAAAAAIAGVIVDHRTLES